MKSSFFLLLFSILLFKNTVAQEDESGCKDHPMFSRMPGFYIYACSENFAALDLIVGAEKTQNHEGTRTHVEYRFNGDNTGKRPSWLQVTRNYDNAVTKIGGKKIYGNTENASYQINRNGKDILMMVTMIQGEDLAVEHFGIDILEKEPMKQDISASNMYAAINTSGSVALNILFETGKTDIKPESMQTVAQLAEMLKAHPTLKISIEGHTDNVGDPSTNKSLSANRAYAVLTALAAQGVDKGRMAARGWGQERPVADNKTEEGRAKNRRVEIVDMKKVM
jgi:OmpA-OmpF porin, OOP family